MFGWLRPDPVAKLRRAYAEKQEEAMALQRKGDIPAFAVATREAEALWSELEAAERSRNNESAGR